MIHVTLGGKAPDPPVSTYVINNRIPLQVAALAFAIGLTIQLAFLLLDLLYRWIDPRMRQAV